MSATYALSLLAYSYVIVFSRLLTFNHLLPFSTTAKQLPETPRANNNER